MKYDYVIAGGGSAGCPLAARLSDDTLVKVMLLKAGVSDWNPLFH
jgi:choline dehydrogenase-like flavoprotein